MGTVIDTGDGIAHVEGLPGVTVEPFTAVDGGRGANLRLDNVQLGPDCVLGKPGDGLPLLESLF